MKFRYHRGSLEESLATTQKFNLDKIITQIGKTYIGPFGNKEDGFVNMQISTEELKEMFLFNIKYYGWDDRVNQNLYLLSATMIDYSMKLTIGFLWDEE